MVVAHPHIVIGGLGRDTLVTALRDAGVHMNDSADSLLALITETPTPRETVTAVDASVADLGLDGAAARLPQILASGQARGLDLWPLHAAPYLRLAMLDQATAPDSVLSAGRAPTGALTVASPRPRPDDDAFPAGFYLRVVDRTPWLRGYRCSDDYVWPHTARFLFRRS